MVAKGLNVREAEALSVATPRATTSKQPRTPPASEPDLRAVEADLSERLGLEVNISFNGRSGVVKLHYQTLDQLDHVIARLGRS